jgi:hypothetical protein
MLFSDEMYFLNKWKLIKNYNLKIENSTKFYILRGHIDKYLDKNLIITSINP